LANFYGELLMLMPAFSCLSAGKMAEPIWYYSFLTISLIYTELPADVILYKCMKFPNVFLICK